MRAANLRVQIFAICAHAWFTRGIIGNLKTLSADILRILRIKNKRIGNA